MKFREYLKESEDNKWYHGSSHKIEKFSTDFVGEGTDQDGPGIYFSNNEEDASTYSKKEEGSSKFLYVVELNFKKLVPITGRVNTKELEQMIYWSKNNGDEQYETNWSNWDEDEEKAIKEAIKSYSSETPHEAFQSIAYDWYKDFPQDFCSSMRSLEYDGVIVKRQFMNVKHAIVYNPKIIRIIEVL